MLNAQLQDIIIKKQKKPTPPLAGQLALRRHSETVTNINQVQQTKNKESVQTRCNWRVIPSIESRCTKSPACQRKRTRNRQKQLESQKHQEHNQQYCSCNYNIYINYHTKSYKETTYIDKQHHKHPLHQAITRCWCLPFQLSLLQFDLQDSFASACTRKQSQLSQVSHVYCVPLKLSTSLRISDSLSLCIYIYIISFSLDTG